MPELLSAIWEQRDNEAFQSLFENYHGRLLNFLIKRGAHKELAADICQETLLQFWRKTDLYNPK